MEKKPKIKIGKPIVHPRTNAICVPYEYDTGESGYRNFTPEQFNALTEEQFIQIFKDHYEQTQASKKIKPDKKMKEITEKEIDW